MNKEPVLQVNQLTRYYDIKQGMFQPDKILRAVNGVSFSLVPGKTLAVVGESGCGKSTLGRVLTLIEPPTDGTFMLDGQLCDFDDKKRVRQLRRSIQMIFQDPYGSLNPRKKIADILEEPLVINTNMNAQERQAAAYEMMDKVGLRREHYGRYPHMFSGGQRQRIAIARALMLRPKVIIADEPVSALDVSIQAQVLNLLMDMQDEFGLAYLFISHDLSVVQHIADDVMVMYLGRPVEQGANQVIFAKPLHPYTRILLASTPRVNPDDRTDSIVLNGELPSPIDPPPGCAFHRRCPFMQERCATHLPEPRQIEGRSVACHFAGEI
jgi:dipeptide transport system ATP-binding protein